MKKQFCLLLSFLLLFALVSPALGSQRALTLASGGATEYRIVAAADAPAAERTAADTLADYLGRITGAVFPVVTDAEPAGAKELVVGVTGREADDPFDRSGWDDDAVRLLADGERLFLTGGSPRGTLYAVYTFLEDWLGCRWFTHELTVVPEQAALTVPADIDYFYQPCFQLRQTYWMFSTAYPEFCAAHKLHGVMAGMPESMGGGRYELAVNGVHTLQQFVPQTLFAEHPEYFGCDENGVRQPNRQPCLRNDDVLRLAVDWAKRYFAGEHVILSVSQNDNQDFCQCDECRAFNAAHGGTDSAALLDFVNRVAAEVKKDCPDATVETLAYQNSLTPPTGMTVADNVVIRLCPISTCVLHGLDDSSCASNKRFNDALTGWAEMTDRIYIWDYSTDFQYFYALYPNVTALQGRYQYYRDRNVVSVFDHGCGDNVVPGEFHELRTYLVCKLLWDPDTDVERHIAEFCGAYYGAAGPDVVAFLKDYEKSAKGYNAKAVRVSHMDCFAGGESFAWGLSLTAPDVRRLDRYLEQAQGRALSEDDARRLEGLTLSWRFTKCAVRAGEFNWLSGFNDPEQAVDDLIADMKAYGIDSLGENGSLRLLDKEANAGVLPKWWYEEDAGNIPQTERAKATLLPIVNRLLRVLFAVPRMLLQGKA